MKFKLRSTSGHVPTPRTPAPEAGKVTDIPGWDSMDVHQQLKAVDDLWRAHNRALREWWKTNPYPDMPTTEVEVNTMDDFPPSTPAVSVVEVSCARSMMPVTTGWVRLATYCTNTISFI